MTAVAGPISGGRAAPRAPASAPSRRGGTVRLGEVAPSTTSSGNFTLSGRALSVDRREETAEETSMRARITRTPSSRASSSASTNEKAGPP